MAALDLARPAPDPAAPMIGVFDSGVGGLSVLRALRKRLPQCPMWYAADSGFAPYGLQNRDYILQRSLVLCQALLDKGARLIVVACNTATTQSAGFLREHFPTLPIVGIEPAVRPAVLQSANGRIAVLATAATLRSARLLQLQQSLREQQPHIHWHNYAPDGLALAIETQNQTAIAQEIAQACAFVAQRGCDTAVLGCTHYPLVLPQWQAALEALRWLDPAAAVAARVAHVLALHATSHSPPANDATPSFAPLRLLSTGNASAWQTLQALVAQHVPGGAHSPQQG